MNLNRFDLKASVHELHKKALDSPVKEKNELLNPETIINHSIIRPSISDREIIIIAAFIWYIPEITTGYEYALLFALAEAAKVLPRFKIKFTDVKNAGADEINIWLPLVFANNYVPEYLKINYFNNIPDIRGVFNTNFYTAYLDGQADIMKI